MPHRRTIRMDAVLEIEIAFSPTPVAEKKERPCFLRMFAVSVHPETKYGRIQVSNSEIGNFGQAQGNQGIARRRTQCTPHKKSRRLTPRSHKRAISGWKLVMDQRSGLALDFYLSGISDDASEFRDQFLGFLEKMEGLPQEILIKKNETLQILEPITSLLKIKVCQVSKLLAFE